MSKGLFIGIRMDDDSTETIYRWLLQCEKESLNMMKACPKEFIYIPIVYSCSPRLDVENIQKSVLGDISIDIEMTCCQTEVLGKSQENISLTFENEWLRKRHAYWRDKHGFLKMGDKFIPRIPMTHCHWSYINRIWHRNLSIRNVRLVNEFITDFDRTQFLREVRKKCNQRLGIPSKLIFTEHKAT